MQSDQNRGPGKLSKYLLVPLMMIFILAFQNCGSPLAVLKHQRIHQELTSGMKYKLLPYVMTPFSARDILWSCLFRTKTTL